VIIERFLDAMVAHDWAAMGDCVSKLFELDSDGLIERIAIYIQTFPD